MISMNKVYIVMIGNDRMGPSMPLIWNPVCAFCAAYKASDFVTEFSHHLFRLAALNRSNMCHEGVWESAIEQINEAYHDIMEIRINIDRQFHVFFDNYNKQAFESIRDHFLIHSVPQERLGAV